MLSKQSRTGVCLSLITLIFLGIQSVAAQTVPAVTVQGNQVKFGSHSKGLAGNSFFWSNNSWGGERYYNRATVAWLKNDWKASIVRASMGIEDPGGYIDDPISNRNRVTKLVDAAIAENLYVIIDWHSHYAENNRSQAVAFFKDMAQRYGQKNNVIFEIYNEPIEASWSEIKTYAEPVIAAIRGTGSDNLIVVGTPFYSQRVDIASLSPLAGDNIAYTLHFYAGTHNDDLRAKARTALANGIALFVTEWGTVNASGDGAVDVKETDQWMNFLRTNNLSHLNWAVNDKQEGASIIKPGTSTSGSWPTSALTDSGKLVRNIIRGWPKLDLTDKQHPTNTPANYLLLD